MDRIHHDQTTREQLVLDLDEIARQGAQRMLASALQAEVRAYLEAAEAERDEEERDEEERDEEERDEEERDEEERALVVRNGYAKSRQVVCEAGSIEVKAPRVNDKRVDETTGERRRFRSSILPPYMRRSPKVTEVLPLLYLHGLSSGDFAPALKEFFGAEAELSPATIVRLTEQWRGERKEFMERDLGEELRLRVGGRDPH